MGTDLKAAILGVGSYVPEKKLTNSDFEKTLETSDEWITSRTGIHSRRIAAANQTTSDLCLLAAQGALKNAKIEATDLDLILVATVTPDYPFPSSACLLQEKLGLGARGTPAFDLNAACSGFLYALSTAKAHIESGMAKNVLIVGAEVLSRITDYKDRSTCILFGDGAGATVVGLHRPGSSSSHAIHSVRIWSDGRGATGLILPGGGSAHPASHGSVDDRLHYIRVNGREVFRFGVTKAVEMIQDVMERRGIKAQDIGRIIPHQANIRIIESASERLGLPMELFFTNLTEYGNTSAASVPLALDEALRNGLLPQGKPVILLAFGAGLTWASAIVEW